MLKRWMMLALIAALLLTGAAALAESAEIERYRYEDYVYTLNEDGGARIETYYSDVIDVAIPEEMDGHPVVEIAEKAFDAATNVYSVTLPASVTKIEGNPFARCGSLSEIAVAEGNAAFEAVDGVLFSEDGKRLVCFPSGLSRESYDVPEGTAIIGDRAFYGVSDIAGEVWMPASVTEIGDYAFAYSSIYQITIPEGVAEIGEGAFYFCTALSRVNIPGSVAIIGDSAFSCCTNLQSIEIPEGVTHIGADAFFDCNLKQIVIPDSVTSIGSRAFFDCHFEQVAIPAGVTEMGENPFESCKNLTLIEVAQGNAAFEAVDGVLFSAADKRLIAYPIGRAENSYAAPEGTTEIGGSAFKECGSLTEIIIPEGVARIGDAAFYNCANLVNAELPQSVTAIGAMAYSGCESMTELEIPEGVASIGDVAFSRSGLTKVSIPAGTAEFGMFIFGESFDGVAVVVPGSAAEAYCAELGVPCEYAG